MQQALTDLQKEVKGLKSKQTPRDQNLRQCHACGKPGHIARFCPRGDVTCYGCGEKGHVVRFCPKGRRQSQNGVTPFTFALINIPASGASLCTPTEPGALSDVTGVVSVLP
jgi:hypothetical protein